MKQTSDNGKIPLSLLAPGRRGIIAHIEGGARVAGRMVSLGFTPGAMVIMLQNFGRGSLIVQVRESQVALGRGEAQKITIMTQ